MAFMVIRLIAFALIAESMFGALYVANLLSQIGIYDAVAIALIVARGALGAAQFIAGWTLANRRPAGRDLARATLAAGAVLTVLGVGFNLAPTSVYYWYRWHVTAAYCAYAAGAVWYLGRVRMEE